MRITLNHRVIGPPVSSRLWDGNLNAVRDHDKARESLATALAHRLGGGRRHGSGGGAGIGSFWRRPIGIVHEVITPGEFGSVLVAVNAGAVFGVDPTVIEGREFGGEGWENREAEEQH